MMGSRPACWIFHIISFLPPPRGQHRYYTRRLRTDGCPKHSESDLYGLSEAALSQHLSVDEVGRPEDAVGPLGHHAQRL